MDLPWMFLARCPRCRGCGSLKSAHHDVKSFSLAKCLFYKLLIFFGSCACSPRGGTGRGTLRSRRDPSRSAAHGHTAEAGLRQRSN